MDLYDLNYKLKVAPENGFIFLHINKLTVKIHSDLRYMNISYYLKFQMPMCHGQFFRVVSQNRDYVDYFRNDRNNPFHFACQKWIKNCI